MDGVKILENGDKFTNRGCGTNDYYNEISKEEYERIKAIPNYRRVLNEWYASTMDDCTRYGYGFYGCGICEDTDTGKYYYYVTLGNSCD